MLIDINAYIGHWPFQQLQYNTCEALYHRMRNFGVDISVISNLNGIFYKNTQSANEELIAEISSKRQFADRFIPFAVMNPIYAGWKADLDVCINKLGFKGVRLYPSYHDYDILDPACVELVKRVRDYGLPVSFNYRMVDGRQRSWMDIAYVKNNVIREWNFKNILPVIREVPDAKYMILNYANETKLSQEETDLIKSTDLLIDTSGRMLVSMPVFLQRFGPDKFAFGTHSPILDYLTGLLRIESLYDHEADENMKELLRSGNARKMLRL